MARYTREQAVQAVQTALANGELTHNDLIDALESSGNAEAAKQILAFSQQNVLVARAVAPDGGGKPVIYYSLPVNNG